MPSRDDRTRRAVGSVHALTGHQVRDEVIEAFTSQLAGLCDRDGITTSRQLAARVGVGHGTAYNWWNGLALPSLEAAVILARAFDVPVGYLVGEEGASWKR